MSMQPMFTIQSSASSSFTSGAPDPAPLRRRVAGRDLDARGRDPVGHVLRRVLLEERLAGRAVGVAAHRERPVLQVRHEHRRDRAVVREQVALRDPLVRPEDLVEVRELERALPLPDLVRQRLLLAHLLRRLVLAQTLERRRAQVAVVRPLGEDDLADEPRLDPDDVALADARQLRHLANGDVGALERPQLREQLVDRPVGEAGADVADVLELAAAVDAEDQRAERAGAPALAARVAADHELLLGRAS